MRDIILFMTGTLLGGLVMWLWMKTRLAWKDARKLMQAPSQAKAERVKKSKQAREAASKGRRQMFWASFFFFLLLVVTGILISVIILNM